MVNMMSSKPGQEISHLLHQIHHDVARFVHTKVQINLTFPNQSLLKQFVGGIVYEPLLQTTLMVNVMSSKPRQEI